MMNQAPPAAESSAATETMVSAAEVADHYLALAAEHGEEVSNLKLQKLLYYAQGWHLGWYGTPLFAEKFQAWASGPVIPELFWRWDRFGIGPVPAPASRPELDDHTTTFLNAVAAEYMPYDVWQLHWMTRDEAPWLNARAGQDEGPCTEELSEADMAAYFHALSAAA